MVLDQIYGMKELADEQLCRQRLWSLPALLWQHRRHGTGRWNRREL